MHSTCWCVACSGVEERRFCAEWLCMRVIVQLLLVYSDYGLSAGVCCGCGNRSMVSMSNLFFGFGTGRGLAAIFACLFLSCATFTAFLCFIICLQCVRASAIVHSLQCLWYL